MAGTIQRTKNWRDFIPYCWYLSIFLIVGEEEGVVVKNAPHGFNFFFNEHTPFKYSIAECINGKQ